MKIEIRGKRRRKNEEEEVASFKERVRFASSSQFRSMFALIDDYTLIIYYI